MIPSLPLNFGAPPEGAASHEGALSLVLDEPAAQTRVRRLPTLYLGVAAIYADRDRTVVFDRLLRTVDAFARALTQPTYHIQACMLNDRFGLHGADLFNRSVFRRKLTRLGMRFSDDAYVRLSDGGVFECADWGRFSPEFITLQGIGDDPAAVVVATTAEVLFALGGSRFGTLTAAELLVLRRLSRALVAAGSWSAEALVAFLEERLPAAS